MKAIENKVISQWIADWERRKHRLMNSGFYWVNPFRLPGMIRNEFSALIIDKVLTRQLGGKKGNYEHVDLKRLEYLQLLDDLEKLLAANAGDHADNRSFVQSAGRSNIEEEIKQDGS